MIWKRKACGAIFSHRRRFNKSLRERIQQQRDEKPAAAIAALGYIKDATLSSSTLALAVLPWRGF
jgi:DeoR/GlpR family transcriptional regulator of sugar metabolism